MPRFCNAMSRTPLRILRACEGEAEPWQVFPHILGGYRETGRPLRMYLESLFRWHNETLNAWTMLGSLAAGLAMYVRSPRGEGAQRWPRSCWGRWFTPRCPSFTTS